MATIVNLGTAWPWPAVHDRNGGTWFESCEENYEYAMGVLPPIYFDGGFFTSEPAAHDGRGVPIYAVWVQIGDRFFVREVARDRIGAALAELREAVAAESTLKAAAK